jgi:hypothetical protein
VVSGFCRTEQTDSIEPSSAPDLNHKKIILTVTT